MPAISDTRLTPANWPAMGCQAVTSMYTFHVVEVDSTLQLITLNTKAMLLTYEASR